MKHYNILPDKFIKNAGNKLYRGVKKMEITREERFIFWTLIEDGISALFKEMQDRIMWKFYDLAEITANKIHEYTLLLEKIKRG